MNDDNVITFHIPVVDMFNNYEEDWAQWVKFFQKCRNWQTQNNVKGYLEIFQGSEASEKPYEALQNPMRSSGREVILNKHCLSRKQFSHCSLVTRFISELMV